MEPQLKYEALHGDLDRILKDETISCLCLSDKILALGTEQGRVHVLDYSGNQVNTRKYTRAHARTHAHAHTHTYTHTHTHSHTHTHTHTHTHLPTSSKAPLSVSGHIALSRSTSLPSLLRLHKWPPFLSAGVRSHTCMCICLYVYVCVCVACVCVCV